MSRYRLAAPAREDLAEIWEFIAEESGEARTADQAAAYDEAGALDFGKEFHH